MGKNSGFRIASKRGGQGSSEYLVVLGAVLVIALIVVTLLAAGTNMMGPNKAESEAYWASTSPIKIISSKMVSGTLILGLQNIGSQRIYLTGLSVSGTGLNLFHYYSADNYGNSYCNSTTGNGYACDIYLQVGKTVYLAAQTAPICPANGLLQLDDVVFSYRTKGITGYTFVGERPLVVPCSGASSNMTLVTFYGYVTDVFGNPIPGANVTISRSGFTASTTSGPLGAYAFDDLVPTAYAFLGSRQLYYNASASTTLSSSVPTRQDIMLQSIPVISFMPPTPSNSTTVPDITINATILNSTLPLESFKFAWNNTNYSFYDNSLVLMYNFDDVAAAGDTAGKVVDLSMQGNNGTVYGNTALLLHMDENGGNTTYDESVNGNNCTCYSGATITPCDWIIGKSGSGMEFNGVDKYATCGSSASLAISSKVTIEAWVKPDSISDSRIVGNSYWSEYAYGLKYIGGQFYFGMYNSAGTGFHIASNAYPVGSWYHLVGTYDSTSASNNLKLYVNGLPFTTTASGSIISPSHGFYVGRTYGGRFYNGSVDEVAVFNKVLTAEEIQQHYLAGKAKHADWDPSGKFGSAMKFDGVNDYINISNIVPFNFNASTDSFSMSAWFRKSSERYGSIIYKQGSSNMGLGYGLKNFANGSLSFMLGKNNVGSNILYSNTIPLNEWHHITGTYNATASTLKLFIDGAFIGQASYTYGTIASDRPLYIGSDYDDVTGRAFNGSIDEVRVWNRALSSTEIAQQYYASLNKYAADKWLFSSTQEGVYAGAYSFQANVKPYVQPTVFSENRTNSFNAQIMFMPPTPATGSPVLDISLNASIANLTLNQFTFSFNNSNYTTYDNSLLLAYNFDDVSAIGDTAGRAMDVSKYGNNGTIYGNTVLLLHMDENAGSFVNDSTIYRNNGTIYGAAWTAGKSGSALNFDGSDDYVNFGDPANGNLDMGTDNFTASFWFRGLIYDRPILSKKSTSGDVDAGLVVYLDSPGWHLRTRIANGTHAIAVSSIRDYLNDNAWHYGTIIKSGNQLFVYVDGTTDNNISVPSSFNINNSINFLLGKGNTGTWNGAIDEVAIHRRALTPSEVLSHYNAGVAKHAEWDPAGKWGSAIKLDGVNDYVNVSSPEGLNFTDQMTISAWTRADNLTLTGAYAPRILNKQGSFEIIVNVPQYNGHSRPEFRITQSGSANYFLANNNLTINGWTFVAFTYNGSKVTSFINGALDRNVSFSGNVDASASGLIIGARNTVQGFFNGTIDEVRIWNRSLSAAEIQQQYYSSLNKFAPDRWFFQYNWTDPALGEYPYYAYVKTSGRNVLFTDSRQLTTYNKIQFASPTPANGTTTYDISINATLTNISLAQMKFSWNGTNYSFYDNSLVLAYNFDDASAAGDTASRVKDVSIYGNNGAIYGNTVGLWHFDEADGNTTFDESRYGNNGTIYGNTRLLLHMDENGGSTAYDGSAYRNNGTISGATWVVGKSGSGLSFDGNDYVDLGTPSSLNITRTVTISAWVKPQPVQASNWAGIAGKERVGNDPEWLLMKDYTSNKWVMWLKTTTTNYLAYDDVLLTSYSGNAWVHFVGTYDGETVILYKNGLEVGRNAAASGLMNSYQNTSFMIGRGGSYSFNGSIDEVAVYSKALNATEVLDQYNAGKAKHTDWTAGKSGTGIQLDGVDDYINITDSTNSALDFRTGNFALSLWLKTSMPAGADWTAVLSKYSNDNFWIQLNPANRYVGCGWDGSDYMTSTKSVNDGLWHHIVCLRTGLNSGSIYVDGVSVLQANSLVNNDLNDNTPVTIGNLMNMRYFNGTIDEVLIANRSLSASEVLAHYNAGRAKHADWDADGKWNSALKFDGADDYLNVTPWAAEGLASTPATLSMWVNGSFGSTIYRQILFGSGRSKIGLGMNNYPLGSWILIPKVGAPEDTRNTFNVTTAWTNNVWNHIAVTYDSSANPTVYLNGVNVTTTAPDNYWTWTGNETLMGKRPTGNFFNGSIDEVRIWNRSLSADEIRQQYYSSLNKYDANKWVFLSNQTGIYSGNYSYQVWAITATNATLSTENRSNEFYTRITFFDPTPANASSLFTSEIKLNATIANTSLSELKLNWNGTNYSFYDNSLVLAYNLDEATGIGDTARKVVDVSRYGNNGTVVEDNTVLAMHFDESDSGVAYDSSGYANTGLLKGDTAGLWHFDEARGPAASDQSGYGNNGQLRGSNTALLLHMDENSGPTAYDESAYGNNGTISGATWISGKSGSGLSFDGTNDQVIVSSFSGIPTRAYTVSAWVKLNELGREQHIAEFGNTQLFTYSGSNAIAVGSTGGKNPVTNSTLTTGTWYFITAIYNSNSAQNGGFKIYINGDLKAYNETAGPFTPTGNLYIGALYNLASGYYFNGSIDEVAIYNRTLTAAEIADHYSAGRAKHLDWVEGKSGTGLQFDGIDDYVNLGTSSSLRQSSEITYSFWAKMPANGGGYAMGTGCAGGQGYGGIFLNNTNFWYWWTPTNPGSDTTIAYDSAARASDTWNHYAITVNFSARTQTMYVNGANVSTTVSRTSTNWLPVTSYNNGKTDSIGGRFVNSWYYFNGTLDEVGVYNRSLSASEIQAQYNASRAKHTNKGVGKSGEGLVLDGVNDYLDAGTGLNVVSPFALEAWIKPNTIPATTYGIIYKYQNSAPGTTLRSYALELTNASGTPRIGAIATTGAVHSYYLAGNISTGVWQHVIAVYDKTLGNNSRWKIYVNGELQPTSQIQFDNNIDPSNTVETVYIGAGNSNTGRLALFNGSIDEVAILNRSLTASEVAERYNAGRAHHSNWAPGKWGEAMRFDGVNDYVYAPVAGNVSAIEYWIYTNSDTGAVMDVDGTNRVMLNALLIGNNATTYINGVKADLSRYTTGSELVQNGGFEGTWTDLGDGNSLPSGWTRSSVYAYPSPDTTVVNTGNNSLHLSAACCAEKQLYQAIPIVQGSYYIYTFYAYGPLFRTYLTNGFTAKDIDPPNSFQKYEVPFVASATNGYLIITNPSTSLSHLRYDDASVKQAISPVQKGAWTHVALVLDEPIVTTNIIIGKVGPAYFNGSIDEVRIWNRSLSAAEIQQHYYGSLSKYAPDKWVFQSNQRDFAAGNYSFMLYANTSNIPIRSVAAWALQVSPIGFFNPTPANNSAGYNDTITINASLATPSLSELKFDWNGTNYTFYDGSLMLAYNFDDISAVGDTASKATDVSMYGNNGTVYGNTALLLHMDENTGLVAYDESAYGNNGTISGATWVAGKSGRALSFDGVNDYVNITSGQNLNLAGAISVGAWIKTNIATSMPVVSNRMNHYNGYTLHLNSMGIIGFFLTNNTALQVVSSTNAVTDGAWHYVVGSWAGPGNSLYIYVDGVQNNVSTTVKTDAISAALTTVKIGYDIPNNAYFNGTIDEVMIANRSLSASEVLSHYNAGKAKHADWDADGKFGSAIKFDGVDDYAAAPTSFTGIDYTWSAWVNAAELNGNQHIIGGRRHASYWSTYGYGLSLENDQLNGFLATNGDTYFYQNMWVNYSSYLNAWTHLALTWSNTSGCEGKLYVNGALAKALTHCMSPGDYTARTPYAYQFTMGRTYNGANAFNGSIDEVRIWNRALSADEIRQQYYGSLNKFDIDKWVFRSNVQNLQSGQQNYYIYARDGYNGMQGASDNRTIQMAKAIYRQPTPENASSYALGANVTINATMQNAQASQVRLGLGNTNYTYLDSSLVLAMDFDDASAAGDTASKATDYSQYGNNGTIYGNTLLLMHMDEGDNKTAYDESRFANNGAVYGNTRLLLHMDEGSGNVVYDESPWRTNGTKYGATWVSGKSGSALEFDGSSQHVTINGLNISSNPTTIEFWFKLKSLPANQPQLYPGFMGAGGKFTIEIVKGSGAISTAGFGASSFSNGRITDLNWHHLALVISGTNKYLYLDGQFDISDSSASMPSLTTIELGGGWSGLINAAMDEVAIYSKALNATEVADHYNTGKAKFTEWTTGKSGTGLQFDGMDDYVAVPDTEALRPGNTSKTISLWVKANSLSLQALFGKGDPWHDAPGAYSLMIANSTNLFGGYQSVPRVYSGTVSLTTNWMHLALVADHVLNKFYFYKDGTLVSSHDINYETNNYNSGLVIGAYQYQDQNVKFFNGSIDEFAIYNRSISATEVSALYNAGKAKHADWDPDGKWGSAMRFDGVNDYVNVGNLSSINFDASNPFSFTTWIKPSDNRSWESIIVKRVITGRVNGYGLDQKYDRINFKLAYHWNDNALEVESDSVLVPNYWYHVAVSYNGTPSPASVKIFVNGVQRNLSTIRNSLTSTIITAANLEIGGLDGTNYPYNGSMDEVRIWNRSLSADEIRQQYYGSLNKYDTDKWAFTHTAQYGINNTNYYLYATTPTGEAILGQTRQVSYAAIGFVPSTLPDGYSAPAPLNVTVNATIQNISLSNLTFGWNSTTTPMYDASLVLAYNFDDISAVGDTASKATDVSRYGNNGTIYGNTQLLMHFDEADGNTAFDESRFGNNGTIYGNTRLLLHMDENTGTTAYDASLNPVNGTCYNMNGATGQSTCNWTAGKSGMGIRFDGMNDYVSLGSPTSLNLTAFTVESWVKYDGSGTYAPVLGFSGNSYHGLFLKYTGGNVKPIIILNDHNYKYFEEGNLWDGNWHHVAFVVTGNAINDIVNSKFYVDGASMSVADSSASAAPQVETLFTLGSASGSNYYYNGSLDEVAIYNKSLSAAQVLDHYNAGKAKFIEWTNGKSGGALNFDGADDIVRTNQPVLSGTGDFTTMAWIRRSVVGTIDYIMGNYGYGNLSGIEYYVANNKLSVYITGGVMGATNLSADTWYHVAATRASGAVKLYVNGVQDGSGTLAGSIGGTLNWTIGNGPDYTSEAFGGSIDEPAVFSRALSASEVLAQYNAGKAHHADWVADGKWASAMKFDGGNNRVSMPTNGASKDTGTISLWFNSANNTATGYMVTTAGTQQRIYLVRVNNDVLFELGSLNIIGSYAILPNVWYHMTGSWNGSSASMYINGKFVASNSFTALTEVQNPMIIGCFAGSQCFNGTIDEVRVWNRTLTAAEIQQQYYSNLAKYDSSKWLFTTTMPNLTAGTYNYYITAAESQFGNTYNQSRTISIS